MEFFKTKKMALRKDPKETQSCPMFKVHTTRKR